MREVNKNPIIPYIAGIFDGGGSIYFRISNSNRELGYRINPTIILNIGACDAIYGMIDEKFLKENIQYKVNETKSGLRRIEIDTKDNVKKFLNLVDEHIVQHKKESRLISKKLFPARESGEILSKENFVNIVRMIEEIQPRRLNNKSVKYTSQYFKNIWNLEDIELENESITVENQNLNNLSDLYMAGFFDGCGKIRPIIHKTPSNKTGYNVSIRLCFTRSWLNDYMVEYITDYLNHHDIYYNINKQNNRISIYTTDCNSIKKFIRLTEQYLIKNLEISNLTYNKIIPAYEDKYHESIQGIYDIVKLYEIVLNKNYSKKYTSKYFEQIWENKIIPLDSQ